MSSNSTCPFCGSSVSETARYCNHCGTPLAHAPLRSRRDAARTPLQVSAWVAVVVLFVLFSSGTLGGFRYQASRWPWSPVESVAAATPELISPPPPPQVREPDPRAAEGYRRSVVSVNVRGSQGNRTGSGFILDTHRHVVTVAHVLEGLGSSGCVTVIDDDGKPHFGKVAGKDSNLDVAVVEVPTLASWPTSLTPGRSTDLKSGEGLFVVGSPQGVGSSTLLPATFNRRVQELYIDQHYFTELLQVTGAVVLAGSSGGPLVEKSSGRVVGVVNAGAAEAQVGYAVPMDQVQPLIEQWVKAPSVGACAMEANLQSVPVTLATITPLSGPFGIYGADLAHGAELALRDMESDLRRVGYDVELREYDDQSSPSKAVEIARSAAFDRGVVGVLGSLDSQVTRSLAEALKESSLPMVAPMAGADDLTGRGWAHFNRLVANSRRQEQAAARFARDRLKAGAIALLEDGSAEAAVQAQAFQAAAQVISLPVVEKRMVTAETNYADLRERLKSLKADVIFLAVQRDEVVRTLQALRNAGIDLPIMGSDTLFDRLQAQPAAELENIFFSHLTVQASDSFQKHFETTLGMASRGYAAYGYDAARVILETLVRFGEGRPARIPERSELAAMVRQTAGYPGRAGSVTFDDKGENRTAWIYIFEWKNGRPELRDQLH